MSFTVLLVSLKKISDRNSTERQWKICHKNVKKSITDNWKIHKYLVIKGIFLNNTWIKKEISKEAQTYFE